MPSGAQVEDANQSKQAARGGVIDRHLAGEPFDQQRRSLVMQRAPPDIDRLDPGEAMTADRLVMALADQEIVLDDAAERRERQHDRLARPALQGSDLNPQPVFLDREIEMKWPGAPGR